MENPVIDLIHRHASVRHYKPDPVSTSMVETVISAAQCASTSSNLQAYSVVAVTDADMRSRISKLCGNQSHIREAPVFLAWCADLARLDQVCKIRGYAQVSEFTENFLIAALDTTITAQNAALAAESLGLGICYIGSIRNRPADIIELLGLPKLTFPIIGMTLGWPDEKPNIKPRLPLNSILHWGSYNPVADVEHLRSYDSAIIATGIYNGRQVKVPGKPEETEDYGWMEHSAIRVSRAARTDLRPVLEQQGFCIK